MIKYFGLGVTTLVLCLLFFSTASADDPQGGLSNQSPAPTAGERIDWRVISSGGTEAISASYRLAGTLGQTAVGEVLSASNRVNQGFWQDFGPGSCCNLAGDANNNGIRNILDVTYTIAFLYKSGPPHPDCHPDEMDASGNGVVNILDVTYMIAFLYKEGPPPVCP